MRLVVSIVTLLIAGALPLLQAQGEVAPESEPFLGILQGQGVPLEDAKRFVSAVDAVEVEGDVSALRSYQTDDDKLLSLLAGVYLALLEPRQTLRRAKAHLANGEGHVISHLLAISLVPRKQSVDYLLRHWERTEDEGEIRIVKMGLRALTTRDIEEREEWTAWWRDNRKTVKLKKIKGVILEAARARGGEELDLMWANDVVMARLAGQEMVKRGILHRGTERLAVLATEHPEDLEVQIGVAMLKRGEERKAELDGVLQRFPGAPLALAQAVLARRRESKDPVERKELAGLCARWIEVDPRNLVPRVLHAVTEHLVLDPERPAGASLPVAVWDALIAEAEGREWNDYWPETVQAQRRVGELCDYPFPWTIESPFMPACGSLTLPARQETG